MAKDQKSTPQDVIREWLDRDLSAEAAEGKLPRAFEADEQIDEVLDLLAVRRFPILIGQPGVGKTAVIHELVRRAHAGTLPDYLTGHRFIQFSLRRRAATLLRPEHLPREFQRLVEALCTIDEPIIPFFCDMHAGYQFDLEQLFASLAIRLPTLILAEGYHATIQAMFEHAPELDPYYFILDIDEPSLERTTRIVRAWSDEQQHSTGQTYNPQAIDQAIRLTNRFQARSHQPRKTLSLLTQLGSLAATGREITQADVIERFCSTHKTPRDLIDPEVSLDLDELRRRFSLRVLGQPDAVQCMINMIAQIKAGLSDVRRPFGVFLFTGPTGVGKTHAAQLLAEYLFGSRERMIRLNMADYGDEAGAALIFGNSEAFGLPAKRGLLTQRLMGHPFAVILLDEFEKAHPRIHDRFLQLMDEGSFVNAIGEKISCRSNIIIATTNAGAEVYRGHTLGFSSPSGQDQTDREMQRRLEETFRFEFLNRFDHVVHFRPLQRDDIRQVALYELEELRHRSGLRQRELRLEIDESVLDWLAVQGYDRDHGARFLRRTIERHVTTALSVTMVRHPLPAGSAIELTVRGNRIVARPEPVRTPSAEKQVVEIPHGSSPQIVTLNEKELIAKAQDLVNRIRVKRDLLNGHRDERSTLIDRMNEPAFWDSSDRPAVLDRFRELDVTIRVEERLARPCIKLEQALAESGDDMTAERLARAYESAWHALEEWEDRLQESRISALWMVISNMDPLRSAAAWVSDLVEMERSWSRHAALSNAVVAYELAQDALSRVALLLEGPGLWKHLAMEEGVHRLTMSQDLDARARIELVPMSAGGPKSWEACVDLPARTGRFDLKVNARGRIDLPERGAKCDWLGTASPLFFHFLHDVRDYWMKRPDPPEVARIYARTGQGATDPRTGAVIPRFKDVMRGRLDPLLEAWKQLTNAQESPLAPGQ